MSAKIVHDLVCGTRGSESSANQKVGEVSKPVRRFTGASETQKHRNSEVSSSLTTWNLLAVKASG